jgi:hypothetical protein
MPHARPIALFMLLALCGATPAAALTVTVSAFTQLGVSQPTAQCIVNQLGQGAQLAEAGDDDDDGEDDEGELNSALEQFKNESIKVANVGLQNFFKNVANLAFKVPANRTNFIRIANSCTGND